MSNTLIAFFSRSGENYVGYSKQYIKVGHTEVAANMVHELTGGDMFTIAMKKPYSDEYSVCMEESKSDYNTNARPELVSLPDSIEKYDNIILAYPNYWNTMPMAVFTFLEAFDFSAKRILPLCTNEGNDLGRSEEDIARLCPKAVLMPGLSLSGSGVDSSKPHIERWLKENGVI